MMLKKILSLILTFSSVVLFAQETTIDSLKIKPTIYLVGAVHRMHFNPEDNYTINDLLEQVHKLKPDVVCGEIAPEAFNQLMEGYFPPEAAALAEMADELHYRFVPADWRLDYATQFLIANNNLPDSVQQLRTALFSNLFARIKLSNSVSLYDDLHQEATLADIDSLFEKIIRPNPLAEIASGSWHERNRRIVEQGLMAAENAHTIVFVFGLSHLPQLQRELKGLGFDAQIPERLFVPGHNFKLSETVLNRWKRNLGNLKFISDNKSSTTYDNYQKVINSNRIKDLEEALQKSQ